MQTTIVLSIELFLLFFLVLLAFVRALRLAVHGSGKKRGGLDLLLVGIVLASLLIGTLMLVDVRNTSNRLADPYQAADLAVTALSTVPEQRAFMMAQREFLAKGETNDISYGAPTARARFQPTETDIIRRTAIVESIARRTRDNDQRRALAFGWTIGCGAAVLLGALLGRREYEYLVANHGFRRRSGQLTFGEVDGLISALRAACEDPALYRTLELTLTQNDTGRKAMLRGLITELRAKQAPSELIDAFICLMDDEVAEKAYTVIYQCERKPSDAFPVSA